MDLDAITKNSAAVKVPEGPSVVPGSASQETADQAGKAAAEREPPPLRSEAAKALVEEIQQHLNLNNVSLSFSTYGENNSKIAVTVTEKDTGRVIREIPSQELRNLQDKLEKLAGLIFNQRV